VQPASFKIESEKLISNLKKYKCRHIIQTIGIPGGFGVKLLIPTRVQIAGDPSLSAAVLMTTGPPMSSCI
jgi:hypothetical protein